MVLLLILDSRKYDDSQIDLYSLKQKKLNLGLINS